MRRKEHFLIIDTETTNTIEQPICYDIGWAITDRNGNIIQKRSFVVAEVFLDMKNLMSFAYYYNKYPNYLNDIKNHTRFLKSIFTIKKTLAQDMKKYHVKKIGAYNIAFDKRALNNTIRYITKSRYRYFFPFNTQFFCIWNMACQTLLNTASYVKFAIQNNFKSTVGNLQTSAEKCYAFITNTPNFQESHTGLEDVLIEIEILTRCFKTHKKMETKSNSNCWRLPTKKMKEMAAAHDPAFLFKIPFQ